MASHLFAPRRRHRTHFDPETRTWSGLQRKPLYSSKVSLADALFHGLCSRPNHIGEISYEHGTHKTNHQLRLDGIRMSTNMKRMFDVRKDDVIVVISRYYFHQSAIVLGACSLAAPIFAISPDKETGKYSSG